MWCRCLIKNYHNFSQFFLWNSILPSESVREREILRHAFMVAKLKLKLTHSDKQWWVKNFNVFLQLANIFFIIIIFGSSDWDLHDTKRISHQHVENNSQLSSKSKMQWGMRAQQFYNFRDNEAKHDQTRWGH